MPWSNCHKLPHNMADSLSRSLAESLIKNDDSKAVENDAPDIHEQTTLMANALKQALAPLMTMRMDEKLAIDSSTDQSGKLIVNSPNRLNKIFDGYE